LTCFKFDIRSGIDTLCIFPHISQKEHYSIVKVL